MSFSLNEKLKEEIVKALINGKCEKIDNVLKDIVDSLTKIKTIIELDTVEEFISLPTSGLANVLKCIPNQHIAVDLLLWVQLDRKKEYDEEKLCRKTFSTSYIDDPIDMVIETNSVEELETFMKKLVCWKKIIYWIPSYHKIIRRPEQVFEKTEEYEYEVKLGEEKIREAFLYIWYMGEKQRDNIRLVFDSIILRKAIHRLGKKIEKVTSPIRYVVEKYPIPIKIYITLKPYC